MVTLILRLCNGANKPCCARYCFLSPPPPPPNEKPTRHKTSPDGNPLPDGKGTFFTYDRIFDEDSSTKAVYDGAAKEIVQSVSQGMNGTIFAYGQTSSGKTFTMQV